jgi:hypothetical protein
MTAADGDVIGSAGRSIPRPNGDLWSQRPELTPAPGMHNLQPLYAVAGNACYRAEALRRLGGFPPFGADDAALGRIARSEGWQFVLETRAVVEHANPMGWRGYAGQMRKHGFYAAQLDAPRHRSPAWWLGRGRHAASALRALREGKIIDAVATVTAVVAQTVGALDAWKDPQRPELRIPSALPAGQ